MSRSLTFAFSVIPQALVADLDLTEFDALAIPGGFDGAGFYEDALSNAFLEIIRTFEAQGKPVASVCVASISLGAAGIMRGRRGTTYHQLGGSRKAQLENYGVLFVDQAIVEDGGLISSTGPGTAVEVALRLLANLTSKENAMRIRKLMRVPDPDPAWLARPQVDAQ